ncbi:MAG TPA: META domain-containing protein [Terriglobia bacterium]|nr:META domain-containing protein [Terriglobia bacterium]
MKNMRPGAPLLAALLLAFIGHGRAHVPPQKAGGSLGVSLVADVGTSEFEPIGAQGAGATESSSENSAGPEPTIAGLPATFVGTLPCADCPGIRYQVDLFPDRTFSSRMTYLERATHFDDHGSWQFASDGKTVLLQGSRGAPQKFALPDKDTLRQLDADGHEIGSKLNYDLKRAPAFAPIALGGEGATNASLENTYWRLTLLGETPVAVASGRREPNLIFNRQTHRVSGSGGCNQITGSYELRGSHLTFGQMARTLMACSEGMDTEEAFLKALAQTKTWKITAQQLELFDGDGHLRARFEAP